MTKNLLKGELRQERRITKEKEGGGGQTELYTKVTRRKREGTQP